jgi:hypothetical protein
MLHKGPTLLVKKCMIYFPKSTHFYAKKLTSFVPRKRKEK